MKGCRLVYRKRVELVMCNILFVWEV